MIRIEERMVAGKRLGRHVDHDPRSRDFAAELGTIISIKHKAWGLPFDQGDIGSCTAEALTGAGNSQPNMRKGMHIRHQDDAIALYSEETAEEGEPYPPNDPGGTGLAVCKAAKKLGWVTSYRHAFGIDQALGALALRPVITGINWYEGFDSPDANGLITISGSVRGGHEVVVDEIIAEQSIVCFWNSWGKAWGGAGRGHMTFDTWAQLLSEQGDVTVPYFP